MKLNFKIFVINIGKSYICYGLEKEYQNGMDIIT